MKRLLALEEIGLFGLSLFMFAQLPYGWGLFALFILVPDVFMVGYLVNKRFGALVYNVGHHRGLALFVWGLGYHLGVSWVMLTGVILFSHASLDRMVGYGLKYGDDFKHSHVQEIPDNATA